jgi:predicted dehydrogenase
MKVFNLAVLGCGGISKSHLGAIKEIPEIKPFVVVDVVEERAKEAAAACGAQYALTDWRKAVAMEEVHIVDICLPHTLHKDPAVEAARHKKHIFTEKPMATNLADTDAMIKAAEENKVTLAVGQVLRFRESTVKAREILKSGKIGEPMNHIRRRVSYAPVATRHPWATDFSLAGGWVLYGFGTHEMDAMIWIADSPVAKLWAQGRKIYPEKDDVDDVTMLFQFANGAMGTLMLSQNIHKGGWEQWVAGTKGSVYITTDSLTVSTAEGSDVMSKLDYTRSMYKQWREFVDALIEGREPSHSARTVRPCMAALEAGRRAINTGQLIDVTSL